MEFRSFLIKYAEIGVKGKNKYIFEDALVKQINIALKKDVGQFKVYREVGRIYVDVFDDYDDDDVIQALKKVFGIVGICPLVKIEDNGWEELKEQVISYMRQVYGNKELTFKVNARRARKNYEKTSVEINMDMGEAILDAFPRYSVDVHHPEVLLNIEIRNHINIYSETKPGLGGMPTGTAGKAMLLLSGGIDSPVAGYMIARRGVQLEAVYFHAPPYTSERAKQKVLDLAKVIASYAGPININVVNFADVQVYIYENCPHEELTIIMKRVMYKIAEHFARERGCLGLVTGESIGQVSSQTMESLAVINNVCTMPVYRPVAAFDKQDIIDIAVRIGTYDISIQPFEDCCTTFVAKHPVTKPTLKGIEKSEKRLEGIDELIREAIENTEVITVQ